MKRCIPLFGVALLWAVVLQPSSAQDDFKLEKGFTSLFNGKDLTGWEYRVKNENDKDVTGKTETFDKRFEVVKGVLVINAKDKDGKGGIRDLYTTKIFDKDFILKLEFRASPKSDSGLYIRGPQLQVRDYPTVGPYKNLKNFKDGDWNLLEVTVTGQTAECKCNGEILTKAMKVPAKGGIGLQAEGGKFEYRRIRYMELPASAGN